MIRSAALAARRAAASAATLTVLAAIAASTGSMVGLMAGSLQEAGTAGLRTQWAAAPPTDVAVQLETSAADDPAAQDAAAEKIFADLLRGTPTEVWRTVQTRSVDLGVGGASAGSVILRADRELEMHAELIDGAWGATDPAGAVGWLHADAASAVGVGVGDRLRVGDADDAAGTEDSTVEVVIAGTWRPTDVADPYWFGESAASSGFESSAVGPLVVDETVLDRFSGTPRVRWTIAPSAEEIRPTDLPTIERAASLVEDRIAAADTVAGESLTVSGDLSATAARSRRALDTAGAIGLLPITLVTVAGLLAFARVASILGVRRRRSTALLSARGLSLGQAVGSAVLEALAVTVPVLLVSLAITLIRFPARTDASAVAVASAGAVAAAAFVIFATVVTLDTRNPRAEERKDVARAGTLVLRVISAAAVVAAVIAFVQFSRGASSSEPLEPVAAFAPTVLLVALSLVAILVLAPVTAVLAPFATRGRGLLPALPARQLGRRPERVAVAALLVVLAIGNLTFAAVVAATWNMNSGVADRLRNGADVRVSLSGLASVEDPASFASAVPYARLDGVHAVAPVFSASGTIGSSSIEVVAMDATRVRVADGELALPVAPAAGVLLPESASSVRIELSAEPDGESFSGWLVDGGGSAVKVPFVSDGVGLTADLPNGLTPWRALSLDADRSTATAATAAKVDIEGVEAVEDDGTAHPVDIPDPSELALRRGDRSATLILGAEPPAVLPIAMTRELATELGATVGDAVTVTISGIGRDTPAVVGEVVDAIPGTVLRLAVAADLGSLDARVLQDTGRIQRANEIWIGTDDASRVSASASSLARTDARVTTARSESTVPTITPAVAALEFGAVGVVGLAVVAVLLVAASMERGRRSESAMLRALGMSRRQQRAAAALELGSAVVVALVLGLVVGAVLSLLVVGGLVGAALGAAAYPTGPVARIDFGLLGGVVGGFLLLLIAGWAASGALSQPVIGSSMRIEDDG